MPRLKRTVTPARLEANRRAALLSSTSPRTPRGKSWSSLNALGHGGRSKTFDLLFQVLSEAPPGQVISMARSLMTPAQLSHPDIAFALNTCLAPGDEPIEADPRLELQNEQDEAEFFEFDDQSLRLL